MTEESEIEAVSSAIATAYSTAPSTAGRIRQETGAW